MTLDLGQLKQLPSPFYRVAVKALIFDEQQRLLLAVNEDGELEIPGGGWEHNETLEEGIRREIREELGVELTSVSPILFTYRGQSVHNWHVRLVLRVTIASTDFKPNDGMAAVRFVTRAEFEALTNLDPADQEVQQYADKIWSEG